MSANSWIKRFPRAGVVVLGDYVADEYVYGEPERVSREAPVLIVRHESSEVKPGGAANVAANVVALGARVHPIGLVGQDRAGASMAKWFSDAGVDTSGLVRSRARVTETKTRILAGGRSTTRQQVLRVDRADERPISAALRSTLRRRVLEAARTATAFVVSDYGSGLVDDALIDELRKLVPRIPVLVDSRHGIRRFHGLSLAKPNEPELEAAAGSRLRDDADVERAGRRLLDELGVGALVVTRGRLGMWLFEPGRRTMRFPVFGPPDAVDVTGAGDTVIATLASALGAGASFSDAVELANVAGGIVVQKPGTATCSARELSESLRSGRIGEVA